jgi:mannose-6-phosphate isomerase-like protein (cupin superfamily)
VIKELALGDVANRFKFENERVKVWEMLLEPGESSDLHHHALDYMLIILEGESIDADFVADGASNGASDKPDRSDKSIHLPVHPGQVIYVPKGNTETAINRSDARYHEILVEFKETRS